MGWENVRNAILLTTDCTGRHTKLSDLNRSTEPILLSTAKATWPARRLSVKIYRYTEKSALSVKTAQHDRVEWFRSLRSLAERVLPPYYQLEKKTIKQDPQILDSAVERKARACRASLLKEQLQQPKLEWIQRRRD